jgi:hypothetical protein
MDIKLGYILLIICHLKLLLFTIYKKKTPLKYTMHIQTKLAQNNITIYFFYSLKPTVFFVSINIKKLLEIKGATILIESLLVLNILQI